MDKDLRCPMCEMSNFKEENGYYVCQICGHKIPITDIAPHPETTEHNLTNEEIKKERRYEATLWYFRLAMSAMVILMLAFSFAIVVNGYPYEEPIVHYNGFRVLFGCPGLYPYEFIVVALVWVFLLIGILNTVRSILQLTKIRGATVGKFYYLTEVAYFISVLYLILGIVASSIWSVDKDGYATTIAYIPVIIQTGLLVGYYVCKRRLSPKTTTTQKIDTKS